MVNALQKFLQKLASSVLAFKNNASFQTVHFCLMVQVYLIFPSHSFRCR